MPYKFHDAHRQHIPKAKYRVRNWPAYNAGLCQRGSITLWLSPDVTDGWKAPKREGRGGEALSIEPWARESSEPLDLVLDSTGLKIFGQGEWCRAKHGRKPRGWKKVHIGLDAKSGMIVSHLTTDKDAGDPDQIDDILDQIDRPICCFMADGAYDGEPVYDAVKRHSPDPSPKVVIAPRKTAVLSSEIEEEQTDRDRHILDLEAKGRMHGRRPMAMVGAARSRRRWVATNLSSATDCMPATTMPSRWSWRLASRFSTV